MLSRKTWFLIATALLMWGGWHAAGEVEVVYSTRYTEDGALHVSKIECGNGPAIILAGRYGDGVLGPATAQDCLRAARTRVAEVAGLALAAAGIAFVGSRYGARPPLPIDQELPRLPVGERQVEGRRPRTGG